MANYSAVELTVFEKTNLVSVIDITEGEPTAKLPNLVCGSVRKGYYEQVALKSLTEETEEEQLIEYFRIGKITLNVLSSELKSFVCFKDDNKIWDLEIDNLGTSLKDFLPRIVFGEEVGGIGAGLLVAGKYSQKYTEMTRMTMLLNIHKSLANLKRYGAQFNIEDLQIYLDSSDPTKVNIYIKES